MQKELKNINNQRLRFVATVEKLGEKSSYGGAPKPTILLKDIKRADSGEAVADHLWFDKGKSWESTTIGCQVANEPCPFLRKGNCSIYEYRSYVCCRHMALTKTSHWCETSRCNDAEFSKLCFSEINKGFDSIRREPGSGEVMDIREVFANVKV